MKGRGDIEYKSSTPHLIRVSALRPACAVDEDCGVDDVASDAAVRRARVHVYAHAHAGAVAAAAAAISAETVMVTLVDDARCPLVHPVVGSIFVSLSAATRSVSALAVASLLLQQHHDFSCSHSLSVLTAVAVRIEARNYPSVAAGACVDSPAPTSRHDRTYIVSAAASLRG